MNVFEDVAENPSLYFQIPLSMTNASLFTMKGKLLITSEMSDMSRASMEEARAAFVADCNVSLGRNLV